MTTTLLRQVAWEVAEGVIDSHDHYDVEEIRTLVREAIRDKPELHDELAALAAKQAINDIEKERAPHQTGQLSLFNEDAILILGDRQRCKMGAARLEDLVARQQVVNVNFTAQSEAFARENGYLTERIGAWVNRPQLSLLELEIEVFGYSRQE